MNRESKLLLGGRRRRRSEKPKKIVPEWRRSGSIFALGYVVARLISRVSLVKKQGRQSSV